MAHDHDALAPPDRRRQAVVAAAVVVALLALAGLGVLLVRGDGDDGLGTAAPTASPTAATASPTASPSASPTPSASSTPSASPTAAPAAWDPADALLSPEAAAAAEQPGWAVEEGAEPDPGPALDPCGDREAPRLALVTASAERQLSSTREAGGSGLVQEVYRYESGQDAEAALATYRQRVEDCPRTPGGAVDELENALVAEASGADRLLVRRRSCDPECTDLFTTYAMVARSGDGLTVATYAVGEDGDPGQYAEPLLDALAEALAAAVPA